MEETEARTTWITADDFGRNADINMAVRIAHESGVLNAASLMVTGSAWHEAVSIAREMPHLEVGLHLVLSDGCAALPPERIPHLVNQHGHFAQSPTWAGIRYWRSLDARRELRYEMEAQFERFALTGLRLSHVDGHQNIHLHPVIFDLLLPMAERWGVQRIRVPHEKARLALRCDHRRRNIAIITHACVFRLLERRARRRMAGAKVYAPPSSCGLLLSGNMNEAYVLRILQETPSPLEIYFHPTVGAQTEALGPNPGDLQTLLSYRVRKALGQFNSRAAPPREREASIAA